MRRRHRLRMLRRTRKQKKKIRRLLQLIFWNLHVVFILFLGAGLLERLLGNTGINVVTRLLGMLLAALSVQFVLNGIQDLGFLSS